MRFLFAAFFIFLYPPAQAVIDNGIEISDEMFPSVAKLNIYGNPFAEDDEGGLCTGTIISPKAILTAAHCFFPEIPVPFFLSNILKSVTEEGALAVLKAEKTHFGGFWVNHQNFSDSIKEVIISKSYLKALRDRRNAMSIAREEEKECFSREVKIPFSRLRSYLRKLGEKKINDRMSELFNELAPLEATHDLAIIVFKKNIFNKSQITTISTTAPSVGAPVAMIGFGITSNGGDEFYELSQKKMELESKWNKKSVSLESYIDEYEEIESGFNRLINGASSTSGVKRWGRNTIHSCSQDLIEIAGVQESSISEKEISLFGYKLWSYLSSSPDGKRASPNHGDSGGPLFLILKESLDPDGKLFPSEVTQIGTVSYGELATDRLHLKKTSYNSLYSTTSRAFLERVNHSRGLGLKLN